MRMPKILGIILLFSIALALGIVGYVLTRPKVSPPPKPEINKIEISSDKKSILNAETKAIIFTIADTQKYLKDSGYFYNPETFQATNAKYEGDCFLGTALSNNKDRIVFSTGCLPGDLPQAWVGIYKSRDYCKTGTDGKIRCLDIVPLSPIKFLIGGSGRNFVWSEDDKTITYEADLGLSGMTETRIIDSQTGDILEIKNTSVTSGVDIKDLPTDLSNIIFEMGKKDYEKFEGDLPLCGEKKVSKEDYIYDFEAVDLNSDGITEFIVTPEGFCWSEENGVQVQLRGAQGNGGYYIFEKINGVWRDIGGSIGGNAYEVLERKTDGYFDILTYSHMSAVSSVLTYYKWQKSETTYKNASDKEINTSIPFDEEVKRFIESQK